MNEGNSAKRQRAAFGKKQRNQSILEPGGGDPLSPDFGDPLSPGFGDPLSTFGANPGSHPHFARQRPADQVETLKKQQKALLEKLRKALLEKLRESQIKAAEDAKARRKKHELAGALVVAELDANPAGPFAVALKELLHSGLKRASQRALFGLPPLPSAPKAEKSSCRRCDGRAGGSPARIVSAAALPQRPGLPAEEGRF
jgi:hypothetical protein